MTQPSSDDFPFQNLPPDDVETISRPDGWTEEDEQQAIDDANECLADVYADAPAWTPPSWWTAEDHERWRIQCEAMEDLGF
jgi:hypothetical protein